MRPTEDTTAAVVVCAVWADRNGDAWFQYEPDGPLHLTGSEVVVDTEDELDRKFGPIRPVRIADAATRRGGVEYTRHAGEVHHG
jgi:hypothetical protein